jgi:hypothetical protein
MATMDAIQKINTSAADGGLKAVLEQAKVNPLLVTVIMDEGVENLMEFSNYFTKDGFEAETLSLRDKVESLRGKQIEVARLRTALHLARGVIGRPAASGTAASPDADMEAPLDPLEYESMAKAWTGRYGVVLTMWLDPADNIVNRLFREFRKNSPSVIAVERVRSVYKDHNPRPEKKVALAGGLVMTLEGKEQIEVVKDIAHYYYALRVLANASAKAGNYEIDSKVEKGTKVVFAPLDVNMDYADHAFRSALKMGQWGTVKWLHERDEHTRGRMCTYMRGGYPQGEALTRAIKDDEIKWMSSGHLDVEMGGTASGSRPDRSRSPRGAHAASGGKGGPRNGPKKPAVGRTQKQAFQKTHQRYANMAKGGKKICKAFNNGNCSGPNCPWGGLHVCSVIENGRTCGGKHPAKQHSTNQGR